MDINEFIKCFCGPHRDEAETLIDCEIRTEAELLSAMRAEAEDRHITGPDGSDLEIDFAEAARVMWDSAKDNVLYIHLSDPQSFTDAVIEYCDWLADWSAA